MTSTSLLASTGIQFTGAYIALRKDCLVYDGDLPSLPEKSLRKPFGAHLKYDGEMVIVTDYEFSHPVLPFVTEFRI